MNLVESMQTAGIVGCGDAVFGTRIVSEQVAILKPRKESIKNHLKFILKVNFILFPP